MVRDSGMVNGENNTMFDTSTICKKLDGKTACIKLQPWTPLPFACNLYARRREIVLNIGVDSRHFCKVMYDGYVHQQKNASNYNNSLNVLGNCERFWIGGAAWWLGLVVWCWAVWIEFTDNVFIFLSCLVNYPVEQCPVMLNRGKHPPNNQWHVLCRYVDGPLCKIQT